MTDPQPGTAAGERRAALAARLHSEERALTQAIMKAFRETDWDELTVVAGDLSTGLARLAAGVAWMEGKRAEQPNENSARQREARHRASVSLVTNHQDEWVQLVRRHRADVDAERGGPLPPGEGGAIAPWNATTGSQRSGLLRRLRGRSR